MNELYDKEKFMNWIRTLEMSSPSQFSVVLKETPVKSVKRFFSRRKNSFPRKFAIVALHDKEIQFITINSYNWDEKSTRVYEAFGGQETTNIFNLNEVDLSEIYSMTKSPEPEYMKSFLKD